MTQQIYPYHLKTADTWSPTECYVMSNDKQQETMAIFQDLMAQPDQWTV